MTTISLPCPLGCPRTVAAEGKCIHFCVDRVAKTHEYVGTLDGQFVCVGGNQSDVENELNQHVLVLCEQGLVDTPLALLDQAAALDDFQAELIATLDPEPTPDLQPWDRCGNCGGAHHVQKCQELLDAFPDPGAAIARQWSRDTLRFRRILAGLDRDVWPLLAAPCARYRGMTTAEVLDRWRRLVQGVALPSSAQAAD